LFLELPNKAVLGLLLSPFGKNLVHTFPNQSGHLFAQFLVGGAVLNDRITAWRYIVS
jgi:hypothetical protein